MKYISYYNSPLGKIMLTSDGEAVTGAWFEGEPEFEPDGNKNIPLKEFPFSEKPGHGWICIFQARIRERFLCFARKERNFKKECGPFCSKFHMEKQ